MRSTLFISSSTVHVMPGQMPQRAQMPGEQHRMPSAWKQTWLLLTQKDLRLLLDWPVLLLVQLVVPTLILCFLLSAAASRATVMDSPALLYVPTDLESAKTGWQDYQSQHTGIGASLAMLFGRGKSQVHNTQALRTRIRYNVAPPLHSADGHIHWHDLPAPLSPQLFGKGIHGIGVGHYSASC